MSIIDYPFASSSEEAFGAKVKRGGTYQFTVTYVTEVVVETVSNTLFAWNDFDEIYTTFIDKPTEPGDPPAIHQGTNNYVETTTTASGLVVSKYSESVNDVFWNFADGQGDGGLGAFASTSITSLDVTEFEGSYTFGRKPAATIIEDEVISTVVDAEVVETEGDVPFGGDGTGGAPGWYWLDEFSPNHWAFLWKFTPTYTTTTNRTTKVVRYNMRFHSIEADGFEANDSDQYLEAWRTVHVLFNPSVGNSVITEENDSYEEILLLLVGQSVTGYPPERPLRPDTTEYDPDDEWDPEEGDWGDSTDLTTLGGGRYNQQLVVLGHRKIYFQELT